VLSFEIAEPFQLADQFFFRRGLFVIGQFLLDRMLDKLFERAVAGSLSRAPRPSQIVLFNLTVVLESISTTLGQAKACLPNTIVSKNRLPSHLWRAATPYNSSNETGRSFNLGAFARIARVVNSTAGTSHGSMQ